ncbi:sugar porter family MFS transporter [Brachybacterium sp. ACRRE]|uniref:sugar porter family MFS transporter n=1 Tax=Brachybacterium sp. ACRRE TaxID=2918184 RepID=UPI001EF26422|nr:sugar porter family MFS transporter [Brachybacterium sp. ACRRE]
MSNSPENASGPVPDPTGRPDHASTPDAAPPGGGVLAALDARDVKGLYLYLAVLATIGGFLFGFDSSNIGSALVFLPFDLGSWGTGITVAGASLGSFVGALLAGPLTDRFGRKSLLLVDSALFALGSIISALAPEATTLIIGRIIIGLAIGADSAIATAYIAEFAPKKRRGSLAVIQQWMITIGILGAYVIAVLLLKAFPDSAVTVDWRIMLGVGFIPAILSLLLRARMPESPRWLLERGRESDVLTAMRKLDIEATAEQVHAEALAVQERVRRLANTTLWTPAVRRALVVVCVFFVFQQITGINVAFYYGPELLGPYFGTDAGNPVDAEIAGVMAAGVLAIVNVLATYFAFRWIDKLGRRKLSIGGFGFMIVFLVIGAIGNATLTGTAQLVVLMITFALFISSFAIGVGGTGWLLQGEIFPTAVRGRAAAIAAAVNWLANFALVLAFPPLRDGLGLSWVMIIFAVLCLLGVLFVHRFLPETNGKGADESILLFEGPVNREDPSQPSVAPAALR